MIGSCPFAYWDVEVEWEGDIVYYVRFKPRFSGTPGPVPRIIRLFLAGKALEVSGYRSQAFLVEGSYAHIYRRVLDIPYAKTATYGTIAREVHTGPRVVGLAMKRNPTPLLIPCHRVVAQNGIGGFSPDIRIKEELLALEKKNPSIYGYVCTTLIMYPADISCKNHLDLVLNKYSKQCGIT